MKQGRVLLNWATEVPASTQNCLDDVGEERERQYGKWGPQHHPDGVQPEASELADAARNYCNAQADAGLVTWKDILAEEFFEAITSDPSGLRKELVQVAAVAVAWVEDIDSRSAE